MSVEVRCQNPTCRKTRTVHEATARAIELGRVDTIDRFTRSTGWTFSTTEGLLCQRCSA